MNLIRVSVFVSAWLKGKKVLTISSFTFPASVFESHVLGNTDLVLYDT